MKRFISFFLVVCIVLGSLNIQVFGAGNDLHSVWVVPNSVKIMQDQLIPSNAQEILIVESAKNEHEGGQVIITAGQEPIHDVTVRVSDLINGENSISKDNVDVYVQHYMPITEPTTDMFMEGWYPDALIPMESYINKHGSLAVEAGKNQGIWFTFKIGKEVPAGIYTGDITITMDTQEVIVPVNLRVWNFTLTDESHSESAFLNQSYFLLKGHPELENLTEADEEFWDMMEKYYNFLLDYRITSTYLPIPSTDIDEFVKNAEKYINDPRVTAYNIPYKIGDFDNGRAEELVSKLQEAGLYDKAYYYLAAEIDEPTPDQFPKVKELSEKIKAIDPNLRHIVTTNVTTELIGYVNTFCSIFEPFHSESYLELVKQRQAAGDDVWWYGCVWPKYPYPTYHIDDYLLSARLISWMQKSYGIKGNLYWSTNLYLKYDQEAQKYEKRDVWKDPKGFPGANGDGFLLYPGYDYGIYGPVPSLRLEAIRDGNEDYEYLWLLEQKMKQASTQLGVDVSLDDIMQPMYERLFTNIKSYTKQPNTLIDIRREVAEMIEVLEQEPTALILIGDFVEGEAGREVQIFAEKGTKVMVDDVAIDVAESLENAERFVAYIPYKAGLNEFVTQLEKDGKSIQVRRKFFANKNAAKIEQILINGFESQEDIDQFTPENGAVLFLSEEYGTQGEYSMKADMPLSPGFPGFYINLDESINFNNCTSIEIDIYNKSEVSFPFYMKFTNEKGQESDNNVGILLPNQFTHISFPVSNFPADFDKSCVNKIAFWDWGGVAYRTGEATLYVDNLYVNAIVREDMDLESIDLVNNGIVLDGVIDDSAWTMEYELFHKAGETDNTANFDILWNDNYLYLAFDVTDDDVLNTGASQPWNDDSVEIYIDGDLTKGDYNENTARFVIRYNDDQVYAYGVQNAHTEKILQKSVKTDQGYSVEVAIPWKALNVGGEKGRVIGITTHINDKDIHDSTAKSSGKLGYTINPLQDGESSVDWVNFELSDKVVNNLVMVDGILDQDIEMDGILDEEFWNINQSIDYIAWPTPSNQAKFGTLWSEKYFYVAFDVMDKDVQEPVADDQPWTDDAVEIFIDGNLTKGDYDGYTGQYIIRYNDDKVFAYGNPALKTEGILQKSYKTDEGYSMEVAIPWENLGITPEEGETIGFTVHVDDNNQARGQSYGVLAYTRNPSQDSRSSLNWAELRLKGRKTATEEDLIINECVFTDATGTNQLDSLIAEGFVMTNVTIKNQSKGNKPVALIVALYNNQHSVERIALVEKELLSGQEEKMRAGFNLPENIEGYYVKVFVWDSLEGMKPLSNAVYFPAK